MKDEKHLRVDALSWTALRSNWTWYLLLLITLSADGNEKQRKNIKNVHFDLSANKNEYSS